MYPARLLLSCLSIVMVSCACSQDWPYTDSQWFYNTWAIGESGNDHVTVDGDSVVNGLSYRKLINLHTSIWDTPNGQVSSSYSEFLALIRQDGDSVLQLNTNGQEFLLFDFGSSVGDNWICSEVNQLWDTTCAEFGLVHVIGTGTLDVNGQTRRYIELEPDSMAPVGLSGIVVEGIGPISDNTTLGNRMLPFNRCCNPEYICDFSATTFGCYTDSNTGLYQADPYAICGDALSIQRSERPLIRLYPNPTHSSIVVEVLAHFAPGKNIQIYNSQGVLIEKSVLLASASVLEIEHYAPGLYIAVYIDQNGYPMKMRFIKE